MTKAPEKAPLVKSTRIKATWTKAPLGQKFPVKSALDRSPLP